MDLASARRGRAPGLKRALAEVLGYLRGARAELEAIVAGLRSLRAPSPRKSGAEAVEP
jgi:hypothetical protein